jgi:hypothetical protein
MKIKYRALNPAQEGYMAYCSNCGGPLEAGEAFCSRCGKKVPPPKDGLPSPVTQSFITLPPYRVPLHGGQMDFREHKGVNIPAIVLAVLLVLSLVGTAVMAWKWSSDENIIQSLQIDNTRNSLGLATFQGKYPAKPFPSVAALQTWVNDNLDLLNDAANVDLGWEAVVKVQNKAMADGWMVSIYNAGATHAIQALVGTNSIYNIGEGANPGKVVYVNG